MFQGYKTVVFFVLVLLVAVANMFGFGDFELSQDQLELFNVLVAVVGLALRYFTNTEIFKAKG